ncbi:zinc finger protein 2 isoform X7 [Chelonia mydas]|uniref:zinc finger protein 2 isoform X7 n=1 Tax=Chelonia mydas TaxID=8469 RepID=UPI001CA8D801|nr:zinc finger protein 2 isoform X7 [Chelonia mydas]
MQENYETVTSLGFPLPKPDLIARLERGEEPWVPDLQAGEEREIPRVTHTGKNSGPLQDFEGRKRKTAGISSDWRGEKLGTTASVKWD